MRRDVDLDELLADIAEVARPAAREGKVADYIKAMADQDPERFGLALVENDGTEHAVGDADEPFAIQSISKVFSLVVAMQKADEAKGVGTELWERVGVEPSGDPFNSLVQLEHERGKPRNPMINAGALIVDDVLLDHCGDPSADITELLTELAGGDIGIDEAIVRQEGRSGHRNRSMAFLMSSFGNLTSTVDEVLDVYVRHCAITMTARQLARAGRFLANDGVDPATDKRILSAEPARRVAAIMLTCGTYDNAGQFAFDVGIPCKSGVAGGIIGLIRGLGAVCVWSPPLDASGNSRAGRVALHELVERLDLSIF
ncbi:MAG TPA: glutaminase [Egibacteraceae bacterium]|nr:glutaminase [Egibacteraceae bacterium]